MDHEKSLQEFQIFVIGGGFSWRYHGAGVIMAMRLKHRLKDDLLRFVEKGGLVLGDLNGFQVRGEPGRFRGLSPKA